MGYARHIGRIGALAVTLGVGVALASTPPIAYADHRPRQQATLRRRPHPSSKTTPSSKKTSAAGNDAASTDGPDGTAASGKDPESPSGSADADTEEGVEDAEEGAAEDSTGDEGDGTPHPQQVTRTLRPQRRSLGTTTQSRTQAAAIRTINRYPAGRGACIPSPFPTHLTTPTRRSPRLPDCPPDLVRSRRRRSALPRWTTTPRRTPSRRPRPMRARPLRQC